MRLGTIIGRTLPRSRLSCLSLVALCACAGNISTPEPDEPSDSGRVASGGRAGSGGAAGRSSVGGRPSLGATGGGGAGQSGSGGGSGRSGAEGEDGGAGPSGGSPGEAPPRMYCDAVAEVFSSTCGGGSCHTNPGATIGDFGVSQENAAAYVSRGSVRDASCGLIIDPREPRDSLILTKVTGDYPSTGNCGGPMPIGSYEITDEQIDCIADWVEQFRSEF